MKLFKNTLFPSKKDFEKEPFGLKCIYKFQDLQLLIIHIPPDSNFNSHSFISKYYVHGGDIYMYPFYGIVSIPFKEEELMIVRELGIGQLVIIKSGDNVHITNESKTEPFGAFVLLIRPKVLETGDFIPFAPTKESKIICDSYQFFDMTKKLGSSIDK